MIARLLESLEPYRLPDAILGQAYESVPPKCRAAIKTAIALTDFYFRPQGASVSKTCLCQPLGFAFEFDGAPCPAAFLIFHGRFQGAARICAAASLATLCGAGQVIAIAIDAIPEAGILATLELCGVEDIFIPHQNRLPDIGKCLSPATPAIYLSSENPPDPGWPQAPIGSGFYYVSASPKLVLLSPASFDPTVLAFCHGKEALSETPPQSGWCDAVFFDSQTTKPLQDLKARLLLEPGCEGFWLFPNLGPEFFLLQTRRFAALAEDRQPFSKLGPQSFSTS